MDEPRDGDSESDVEAPSTSHHHLSSTSRQMRNEAEKKRRDTLNGYITELGRLVPTVDSTPRRIDKISILRLAATYLMQYQILHTGRAQEKPFLPVFFRAFNLSLSMIEDMDAFMLVVTAAGKIVFVSHTVEKLLGHAQIDMFGQSLYNFTQKEDHPILSFNLKPDGGVATGPEVEPEGGSGDDTSCSSESTMSPPPCTSTGAGTGPGLLPPETQRRSFFVQLSQRCVSRSEQPEFKRVHILGALRVPQNMVANRHARRHAGDWLGGEGGASNEPVLVAVVKLDSRIRELSFLEANKDEYITRHMIDGRIIYSDHRISLVAGYLTEEVNGMSAFKFIHQEDVMFTILALRQMYDRGEGFGYSCYRLQSKTGQFIYLRTHGFLEKNEETNEVESFICVNTQMREEDGKKLIQEMKVRYSAQVDTTQKLEEVTTEKEMNLEEAISQLIPPTVEPPAVHSPFPDAQHMKAALVGKSLPPTSVHSMQAALGSPKSTVSMSQSSADPPSPVSLSSRSLGSPESDEHVTRTGLRSPKVAERPSVITSGLRRRRHDSDTLASVKRRRSPQREELVIQVPLQMSPEELSHAIRTRGQSISGRTPKQSPYSPPIKTRRYEHSSDLSLTTNLPLNFLSNDSGKEALTSPFHSPHVRDYTQNTSAIKLSKGGVSSPNESYTNIDTNLSPSEVPYRNTANLSSPNCPYNKSSFLNPSQTCRTNTTDTLLSPKQVTPPIRDDLRSPNQTLCTDPTRDSSRGLHTNLLSPSRDSSNALFFKRLTRSSSTLVSPGSQDKALPQVKEDPLSPNQVLCPTQDVHCPISVPYPSRLVSDPSQASFRRPVALSPQAVDQGLYSLVVSSSDPGQYLIETMLNQSDLLLTEMEQVQVPACSDNRDVDTPLYLIEQSHSQLESNLQIQQMQITSIKHEIKQVPKPHSDHVFKNFTELQDEHKQNQHLLHVLKEDITRSCT